MATIHKFKLEAVDRWCIRVPRGATLLRLGLDPNQDICLWLKVPDTNASLIERTVFCVGTGKEIPDGPLTHIGSVCRGPFVWHFFTLDVIGEPFHAPTPLS
ncbi:hypothetical protein UFOVP783_5 [uncultured Caudovirales phage]|uniref:DUF7352 domain-containing protein n=1 Tax=uncultured Caudovirales phage TaxID=2100421 RepID=A0A6J5P331_9CAUD|nr:hypothetical protein UFOVP783_5 [uncultured Caudovirales phage]